MQHLSVKIYTLKWGEPTTEHIFTHITRYLRFLTWLTFHLAYISPGLHFTWLTFQLVKKVQMVAVLFLRYVSLLEVRTAISPKNKENSFTTLYIIILLFIMFLLFNNHYLLKFFAPLRNRPIVC